MLIQKNVLFFIFLINTKLFAQTIFPDEKDSLLINDLQIQIESTEGLNNMYNFQFQKAEVQFQWLRYKYKTHPLAYFLMGLNTWWKILPEYENKEYDETFHAYMDTCIFYAERLLKEKKTKIEGAFFLAAAYGFKGRLFSDRDKWTKAALAGKSSLTYMDICRDKNSLSPELLFGDGLYNYYSVWIPENYPFLKPIMIFFHKGNKELGIQQMEEVSNNAFYTRTEAQHYLMRILMSEGKNLMRAFQIAEYLHNTFPHNAYFHRYYARLLYSTGDRRCEEECLCILEKMENHEFGYEENTGRYAAFFLGQWYQYRNRLELSKKYYNTVVLLSEKNTDLQYGYYLYALLALGDMSIKENNPKEARKYYKKVKRIADKNDRAWEIAKKNIKKLE
ncbi:MAG: tetratricopeptide repeat protein [Chitinophagaceae bacterium]|nr:tetratricopeptide repeat protein [Chitinophagaceae bacterium]